MRAPLFFPPPRYVPAIDTTHATTVADLCAVAGIACKASGEWIRRSVVVNQSDLLAIDAEPGHCGAVRLTVPPQLSGREAARFALCVLAYGVHDLVARQSVAGHPWTKPRNPPGREKSGRALTTRERQRRFRRKRGTSFS